ncbi:MAG: TetR/AcrR family transcriptional regulator [Pseudomonadota bacterium]
MKEEISEAPAKARRGRPPLPADNETRERILAAAQRLFGERSFTQVNLREITDAANVSLAAVNYHFGSKDGLVQALFTRAAPGLIAERAALLAAALAIKGSREQKLAAVVRALVGPVIRWSALPETQQYYVPFLARVRLDGPEPVRRMLENESSHLQPFVQALCALLPELPAIEVQWRLHFILGIEHALHNEARRLQAVSQGACDFSDPEAVITRVVDFVMPGLLTVVSAEAGVR